MKVVATIITAIVIVAGFAIISPMFSRPGGAETKTRVMLSFSVSEPEGALEWAKSLSSILDAYNIGAVVFITGEVVEQHPEIVSYFGDKVDIGSRTYSNLDLTKITDYSLKLEEVEEGKKTVDNAGNLYSRAFRAPFGATDRDIYSLLSRCGIMADFSYENQYNVYQDDQFVRYDATVYGGSDYSPEFFLTLTDIDEPLIITFDDTDSIPSIQTFLSEFKMDNFQIVNASKLTGLTLTIR